LPHGNPCDANQIDVINRINGQGLKQKFFLLVFAKDEAQAQTQEGQAQESPLQSKNH